MKMIMPLKATESGLVNHRMSPGSIITAGDLLASLQLKDPSKVKKIIPFKGTLNIDTEPAEKEETKEVVIEKLKLVLDGYEGEGQKLVQKLGAGVGVDQYSPIGAVDEELLERYLLVEDLFAGKVQDEAIIGLVKSQKNSLEKVVGPILAHRYVVGALMLSCIGFPNE